MFIVLPLINNLGTIDFWACAIVTLCYSLKYLGIPCKKHGTCLQYSFCTMVLPSETVSVLY